MKKLFLLSFFIIFIGCGYKPVTNYAKKEIQGLVYVDLNVNMDASSGTVFLKDTMSRLIIGQLEGKVTDDKELADTVIYLSIPTISHRTLTSYEGYASRYRTSVTIAVRYLKKGTALKSFTVSEYSDYEAQSDAQLSDQRKEQGIIDATENAMKKVFTKIALNNLKEEQ